MKSNDSPLVEITRRLDFLRNRFVMFDRLERQGAVVDQKIISSMEESYERGLEHLRTLRQYHALQTYKTWYLRYKNNGDPL